MFRCFLTIAFVFEFFLGFAQNKTAFSEVFRALKISDFSHAHENIKLLDDGNLKMQLVRLIKLVEDASVIEGCDFQIFESENELIQITNNIGLAFCYSKTPKPDLVSAYIHYSKAIRMAAEIQESQAQIFAVFCILKLLKNEIFIGSRQHEFYLNYLHEIKEDEVDDLIYTLYSISLDSKEDLQFKSATDNVDKIRLLDSAFLNIRDRFSFEPSYFYERGIQNKLMDKLDEALLDFKKSVVSCTEIPYHQELKVKSLWQISHTYLFLKKVDSAKYFLEKAKESSSTLRDDFYNSRLQAWIHNASGNHGLAYDLLNRSIELEYLLGAKNNSFETALLSVENETEKLKLDNLMSENKRKANRNWLIASTLALLLGLSIAILLQKNTTKKRQLAEQEALLKQQRVDNLLKEQELVSIDAMIAGQEKERQKVAGELHDDLGSLMATIKLHFDNAKVGKKDPALKNAQKLLEEAYQKIRGMAHNKNSGVMSDQGLLSAIKKMAKTITATSALEVTVEDFGLGERLENSLELSIFRMIQELVANAIKHAEASKVTIQLTQHKDDLNIIIEDNGKGFDRSKLDKNNSGMGLTNTEKRVEHLGGNFTVDSVVGKGTSILIDIPV